MQILIDIGHPAHVHLFKNFANEMQSRGHRVFFTCREKEFEIELLQKYGFEYKSFGKKYKTIAGKIWGLIKFDLKEIITGLKIKPDIFISHGSMYAAHAAFLLGKSHISLEDTYNFEQIRLYLPFTKVVLTGDYAHPSLGKKEIRYSGYHELAYLHRKYFKPDKGILQELRLNENDKFIVLRFVSWNASHDTGHSGLSKDLKKKIVHELSKHIKVFISSEAELPNDLIKYKINISSEKMHDVLFYSSLLLGESATMASECAMLGTPSIFLDNTGRTYTADEERKYGLVFNYSESPEDQVLAFHKALELLENDSLKNDWKQKSDKLHSEKINVTAFLVWFVENYPDSFAIMKNKPDYQLNFK